MDPLSSLRFAVSPQLRSARLLPEMGGATGVGGATGNLLPQIGEALSGRAIPSGELEKLGGQSGLDAIRSGSGLSGAAGGGSFESTLKQMVSEVNGRQAAAGDAVNGLLSGQNVPLHQAMIAMEEASVSFQLMVEVRNKLLESYQELMRMQV